MSVGLSVLLIANKKPSPLFINDLFSTCRLPCSCPPPSWRPSRALRPWAGPPGPCSARPASCRCHCTRIRSLNTLRIIFVSCSNERKDEFSMLEDTGCSFKYCVISNILKYIWCNKCLNWTFPTFPLCQAIITPDFTLGPQMPGRSPKELAEFRKVGKNIIFNEHPV